MDYFTLELACRLFRYCVFIAIDLASRGVELAVTVHEPYEAWM